MRARSTWALAACVLLAAVAAEVPRAGKTERAPAVPERNDFGAVPEPESGTIDLIREEREAVLTGTHFTYDQAGRRDPFRSLVENVRIKGEGERPEGIEGMLITEVDLVGIISSPRGQIAFMHGSDNRGYFMRKGDDLYDGRIVDIDRSAGRVTFRQRVDDPREIKPYRDIIKKLYSSREEGQ